MRRLSILCLLLAAGVHAAAAQEGGAEVNVYSARKEALIKPLFDSFTAATGIKVNLVTGKADALIKRLELEGSQTPADLLLTVDAGRLHRAKEKGLLQALHSERLAAAIPARYRDPQGFWFGLSLRARVIIYAKATITPARLSTYEDLADPKWKQQICVRSSANIYNQSLVASLLAHHGQEQTERWISGLVGNFARPPKGGDRDQIKAVAAGQCGVALVNTYYLAAMLDSGLDREREAAAQVALFWPNQAGRGAHVNISGAGVTRAAGNRASATRLLEYLAAPLAQEWYAKANHEFPVRPGVPVGPVMRAWGDFKADPLALEKLGENNPAAVRSMDRAGWR